MISDQELTFLVGEIPEDPSEKAIHRTARELKKYPYTPPLILETPGFLLMGKKELLTECRRVSYLSDKEILSFPVAYTRDPDRIRRDQIRLLVSQYELLHRLRMDDAEAWDQVHELYADD